MREEPRADNTYGCGERCLESVEDLDDSAGGAVSPRGDLVERVDHELSVEVELEGEEGVGRHRFDAERVASCGWESFRLFVTMIGAVTCTARPAMMRDQS